MAQTAEEQAYQRAYNATHRAERNAYRHAYYATHREATKTYQRAYNAAHPEERRAYAAAHPDIQKNAAHRRRALARNARYAPYDFTALCTQYGWTCCRCVKPIDPTLRHPDPMSVSRDHYRPLARGGGDNAQNVRPAHLTCNIRHRDNLPPFSLPLHPVTALPAHLQRRITASYT